jgi:hypothetical protein
MLDAVVDYFGSCSDMLAPTVKLDSDYHDSVGKGRKRRRKVAESYIREIGSSGRYTPCPCTSTWEWVRKYFKLVSVWLLRMRIDDSLIHSWLSTITSAREK